jgi:aminoglycoside/choline kinase family phosphotransferase
MPGITGITPLPVQASDRRYYRLHFRSDTRVAMVYPQPAPEAVNRIESLAGVYREAGLNVPRTLQVIDSQILVQDDLGDEHLDRFFSGLSGREKDPWWNRLVEILCKLKSIPCHLGSEVLDISRMQWEMNFCINHYIRNFVPELSPDRTRAILHRLVEQIRDIDRFAHRDLHSQNILVHRDDLWLVDFQNSLQAPRCYDLVSLLFDAYLDTGSDHPLVLKRLKSTGYLLDMEQFHLTALQRNFKALGTFGYQIRINRNRRYRNYLLKCLGDIRQNPLYHRLDLPL